MGVKGVTRRPTGGVGNWGARIGQAYVFRCRRLHAGASGLRPRFGSAHPGVLDNKLGGRVGNDRREQRGRNEMFQDGSSVQAGQAHIELRVQKGNGGAAQGRESIGPNLERK